MNTQMPGKSHPNVDTKPEKLPWYSGWWLLAIAVCSAIALAWVFWRGWQVTTHTQGEQLGQLGDYFGGILNPLVSTLTLFVAIGVWRLQKKEVEETRRAIEVQAKTAEQQRQEQRFFDLLNVYQRTVDSIFHTREKTHRDTIETVTANGKSAFSAFLSDGRSGPSMPSAAMRSGIALTV